MHALATETARPVADDLAWVPLSIVNVYLYGPPGAPDRGWVLIDAGLSTSAGTIRAAARERFGDSRPLAIVLTHGHFDHVGSLKRLAEEWDVPVFAHPLELPYLTGKSDYPPPDPTVGGGLMAVMSRFYSRAGIDLGPRAKPLPPSGAVPGMAGWRSVHTPGHSPGHVSLFRDADRTLVAGDAFVTTKQESAVAALFKPQVVHGPPMYFTIDWPAAARSVRQLAGLRPELAVTGHGRPMDGEELRRGLNRLAQDFERQAVPTDGRYVRRPAVTDNNGVRSVPPANPDPLLWAAAALGVGAAVGWAVRRV